MSLVSPTALPYFAGAAAGVGGLVATIGIMGVLSPEKTLKEGLELPLPKAPEDKKAMLGLTQIYAVRDISIGLSCIGLWYFNCRHGDTSGYKALGITMLLGNVVVGIDGLVSKRLTGKGEWKHWGFAPVLVPVGLALVGVI